MFTGPETKIHFPDLPKGFEALMDSIAEVSIAIKILFADSQIGVSVFILQRLVIQFAMR
jgi:hypothetical protein